MNPDNMDQFKLFYDYSKENQLIYEKYIKSGMFTEEDLKDFETLEVVQRDAAVDDEDEWKSIDEEEFEGIMVEPNAVKQESDKYYDLRNFAFYHTKKQRGDELKLPNGKLIGHKKYEVFYKQKLRPLYT